MNQNPPAHPEMGRAALPDHLFPMKLVPVDQYCPRELEAMLSRPEKIVPAPPNATRLTKLLALHRGRTPQGRKNSLANLRRPMPNDPVPATAPQLPAGMPQPTVPVAEMPVRPINALKARFIKSVLTKQEFDLYLLTWETWMRQHDDYNEAEDMKDLETVCKEEVIQYRIDCLKMRHPNRDFDEPYNQSHLRQQRARDNLAARRDMRLGINKGSTGKGNTTNHFNVAIVAGQVDERKLMEMQREALGQQDHDIKYLEGTSDSANQLHDIIDVEVVQPTADQSADQAEAAQPLQTGE